MIMKRRTIGIGILLGLVAGLTELWVLWRFIGLESDAQHLVGTVFGFLGLIGGTTIVVVWSRTPAKGYVKWQGVTGGGAVVCGGTMALLWAARADETLQLVAAGGTILLGLLARKFRRSHHRQPR